jgi:hypothetical protein
VDRVALSLSLAPLVCVFCVCCFSGQTHVAPLNEEEEGGHDEEEEGGNEGNEQEYRAEPQAALLISFMYLGTTPREGFSLGNIYISYLNLCVRSPELRNT